VAVCSQMDAKQINTVCVCGGQNVEFVDIEAGVTQKVTTGNYVNV